MSERGDDDEGGAAQVSGPNPFDIPCELASKTQMVQPVAFFLLAAGALAVVFAQFFGNHRPVHWQLITGVSIETAVFVGLAAGGFYTLRHVQSLELTSDGVAIHGRIRTRRLAWTEVEDVVVKVKSSEGLTFVFPAIMDSKGKVRFIPALMEFSGKRRRAEDATARLLATRDLQLTQLVGR